MNITEANATHLLLDWLTGEHGSRSEPVSEHQAREAACYLTDRARLALGAGPSAVDLAAAWSVPIGVCSLCPTRLPAAELVPHIREMHPGVLGERTAAACPRHWVPDGEGGQVPVPTVDCPDCVAGRQLPVVDVNDAPARPAVSDLRDRGEPLPTARISWDGVAGQLELDGYDISRAVNAATLHLEAREVARLDLQLNVMAVEAGHVDHVYLKLYMPDEARELLVRQGWTPPAEEATPDA